MNWGERCKTVIVNGEDIKIKDLSDEELNNQIKIYKTLRMNLFDISEACFFTLEDSCKRDEKFIHDVITKYEEKNEEIPEHIKEHYLDGYIRKCDIERLKKNFSIVISDRYEDLIDEKFNRTHGL